MKSVRLYGKVIMAGIPKDDKTLFFTSQTFRVA